MRNYINLFFLSVLFLAACGSKKAPPGILQADDMAALLTDVHIVDGTMYTVPLTKDSLYKYGLNRYITVFKQHNTDSVQFMKSLQYYSKRPDQLNDIYTQVVDNLQQKSNDINKLPTSKNALPRK